MRDCLLPFALIHCLLYSTLIGQVETVIPDQPEVIVVNTGQLDAFQNLEIGNYAIALEQFEQLLKEKPHYISALIGRAKSLFQLRKFQEAHDAYLKVLEKNASDIHSLEGLGSSALFLNQTDLALSYFNKALDLKPDNARIYHAIAVSQICNSDYLNAAESAKMASLMYNKKGLEAPYSLIIAYFSYAQMNDRENMQQVLSYSKKLDFSPEWPLPIIEYMKGEIEASELISIVQSDKEEIEAHTYIGLQLQLDGEFQASKKHLNWVQKSNRNDIIETLIAKHMLEQSEEGISHAFHY